MLGERDERHERPACPQLGVVDRILSSISGGARAFQEARGYRVAPCVAHGGRQVLAEKAPGLSYTQYPQEEPVPLPCGVELAVQPLELTGQRFSPDALGCLRPRLLLFPLLLWHGLITQSHGGWWTPEVEEGLPSKASPPSIFSGRFMSCGHPDGRESGKGLPWKQ